MPVHDCLFLNGDSYSALDPNITTYGEFVSQTMDIPLINKAEPGSSNDRIIRSSVESIQCLLEKGHTPMIIIGLSFVRRLEIWYYGNTRNVLDKMPDRDSNLHSRLNLISLNYLIEHGEITAGQKELMIQTTDTLHKKLIDFYMNLFLFCNWLEKCNLGYFVFSPANNTDCTLCSLKIFGLKFSDWCTNNPKIWKLHDFCFQDWAKDNDSAAKPTGHLSTNGHRKFANLILPNLESSIGEPNGTV